MQTIYLFIFVHHLGLRGGIRLVHVAMASCARIVNYHDVSSYDARIILFNYFPPPSNYLAMPAPLPYYNRDLYPGELLAWQAYPDPDQNVTNPRRSGARTDHEDEAEVKTITV